MKTWRVFALAAWAAFAARAVCAGDFDWATSNNAPEMIEWAQQNDIVLDPLKMWLFMADIEERLEPSWSAIAPNDDSIQKAVKIARDYSAGLVSKKILLGAWTKVLGPEEAQKAVLDVASSAAWLTSQILVGSFSTLKDFEAQWQAETLRKYFPEILEINP